VLLYARFYCTLFVIYFGEQTMLISRNAKILTALLLAVSLAACSTTKKADTSAAAAEQSAAQKAAAAQAAADKAAADKAAADAAARASAASTSNDVNSQALATEKANEAANALNVKIFHFDFDSSSIAASDYDALKAHAKYLSTNPKAHVRVSGNTDERGTREYNMALGERRAKSVAAFLTSNGAKNQQLEVVSYGQEKPVATGSTEEAWAQNRRVELEYTNK
jgi:peptidoglycan-associated lipoprotein